jgi:hypothetical protein
MPEEYVDALGNPVNEAVYSEGGDLSKIVYVFQNYHYEWCIEDGAGKRAYLNTKDFKNFKPITHADALQLQKEKNLPSSIFLRTFSSRTQIKSGLEKLSQSEKEKQEPLQAGETDPHAEYQIFNS